MPEAVKAMLSPMKANLEAVTIDYGLYGGRFWLPRAQSPKGRAQVCFMRVPFKMEESFKYASVNGTDSMPKVPAAPKSIRDSLFGDSVKWRDLSREERKERALRIAEVDSIRRVQQDRVVRKSQCDSSGTYTRYDSRYNGAVRVAICVPCDSTVLANSPDLPGSIYEPGEELFGIAERDELMKSLGFSLQPGWAPQKPTISYGAAPTRYNRVEGFSTAVGVTQELGQGYRVGVRPSVSVSPTRSSTVSCTGPAATGGVSCRSGCIGASTRRTIGASRSASAARCQRAAVRARRGILLSRVGWRADRLERGRRRVHVASVRRAAPDRGRRDAVLARERDERRAVPWTTSRRRAARSAARRARYAKTLGLDPEGMASADGLRGEAAAGTFDYTRGAIDATVSRGFGSGFSAAVTGGAGVLGRRASAAARHGTSAARTRYVASGRA